MALCAGFLRISGAMCSLTFNFASARIKFFPASTRKYLPQFRVSILCKNYEGRSSLKTQLKIEFLLPYTGSTKVLENIPETPAAFTIIIEHTFSSDWVWFHWITM